MAFFQGIKQMFFTQNFVLKVNYKNTDFQNKAMNFTTGQKITEI